MSPCSLLHDRSTVRCEGAFSFLMRLEFLMESKNLHFLMTSQDQSTKHERNVIHGWCFQISFYRKFFFESSELGAWLCQKSFLIKLFKKDNNGSSRMRRRRATTLTTSSTTKLSYGLLSLWRKRSGFPFLHPQRSSFVPIKHGHFKGFTVCRDRPIYWQFFLKSKAVVYLVTLKIKI